jgi:hypothetical protein
MHVSTNVSMINKNVSTGQEYQPGTPDIYQVVEYFRGFGVLTSKGKAGI